MEREVGGGIGMGNTCKPMAFSFQCVTKSITKKKKNLVFLSASSLDTYFKVSSPNGVLLHEQGPGRSLL